MPISEEMDHDLEEIGSFLRKNASPEIRGKWARVMAFIGVVTRANEKMSQDLDGLKNGLETLGRAFRGEL